MTIENLVEKEETVHVVPPSTPTVLTTIKPTRGMLLVFAVTLVFSLTFMYVLMDRHNLAESNANLTVQNQTLIASNRDLSETLYTVKEQLATTISERAVLQEQENSHLWNRTKHFFVSTWDTITGWFS